MPYAKTPEGQARKRQAMISYYAKNKVHHLELVQTRNREKKAEIAEKKKIYYINIILPFRQECRIFRKMLL